VGVDAVEALAAAAARAGVAARAMAPALRALSYPGLSGIVRFDAAGNRLGEPPWLGVQAGRFVVLP
jgi:ABC-type branched-subunit amino acid transport system substrate-binding protein